MDLLLASIETVLAPYIGTLLAITALIGAVFIFKKQMSIIWRVICKFFKSIVTWVKAPSIVLARMTEQDKILLQIKAQIFPNGGSSISDKLSETLKMARRAERRSFILAGASPIPTYECDPQGHCLWVNAALAELFGMERFDMLGTGWLHGVDSSDKARVWNAFQEAIALKIPYSVEYTVVNQKTGARIKCFAEAEITREVDGSVLFVHGTVRKVE